MTAIMMWNGRVLHDSSADLYGVRTTKLDKVQVLSKPFNVRSLRNRYKDQIVGVAGSGPGEILEECLQTCRRIPIDNVIDSYQWSREKGLMNDANQFTLLLIGVKGTVRIEINREECSTRFIPHAQETLLWTGSCTSALNAIARDIDYKTLDLCRLMYACFAMEPTCYGYISAYEVVPGPKPRLEWVGMNGIRTPTQIRKIASRLDLPYPFDLHGAKGPYPWPPMDIDNPTLSTANQRKSS